MWEWKSEDEAYDELYHYGVLGMKWGVHKAAMYFRKAGENYGRYLRYKDKSKKLTEKAAKNLIKTTYDKSNNVYTHTIKMKNIDKYSKKIKRLADIGQAYATNANIYNKKAYSVMNKYNIKKGKDFVYKNFDRGLISGRTNNTYALGGIIGGSIGAYKSYKTLKNEGHLHEEYYNKR
jgi:hypothetical protein